MNSLDLSVLHTNNTGYRERFLKLSEQACLREILAGNFFSWGAIIKKLQDQEVYLRVRVKKSVVIFVEPQLVEATLADSSAPFTRFIADIKQEVADCFFFNPLSTLHFSLATQDISNADLSRISALLRNKKSFEISISGFSVNNFINGRIFLNVHGNFDELTQSLKDYGAENYNEPRIGFLNLKRDLTPDEKVKLKKLLADYEEETLFGFKVTKIFVVEQDNSLMVMPKVLEAINLL